MKLEFKKPAWPLLLFSLPFFGVGIGFLFFSILPSLYQWQVMSSWDVVGAKVTEARLIVNHGDSTTYQATASYRYEIRGREYTSNKIGLSNGSDNIGDWQHDMGLYLESKARSGAAIEVYVDPDDPTQSIIDPKPRWTLMGFKMIFVILFGGVGGFLFFGSIIENVEKPITIKSQLSGVSKSEVGQLNQFYSDAKKKIWVFFGLGLIITLISSPVLFAISDEWEKENYLVLLALIFPLIGIFFLVAGLRSLYRWLKFGRSPLVLDPFPGGIGGVVGGKISIGIRYDHEQVYRVSLICMHSKVVRNGGKSSTTHRVRWSEEGIAYTESGLRTSTELKFAFEVPESLPETTEVSSDYIYWQVRVQSNIQGVLFERRYEIPVYETDQPLYGQARLSIEHPFMDQLADSRIERLNIQEEDGQLSLYYPMFHDFGQRAASILFGSVFVASGVGIGLGGGSFIFPLFFVPIGGLFIFFAVAGLIRSYKVTLSANGIETETNTLGVWRQSMQVEASKVIKFETKNAHGWKGGNDQKVHCLIEANLEQGKAVKIVERVESKEAAKKLVHRFEEIIGR